MTTKERDEILEQLRAELLEEMRRKPEPRPLSPYVVAAQNCEKHFEAARLPGQYCGALMACEDVARKAFRERHKVHGKGNLVPARYIATEEDGAEYFQLFKDFFGVYQAYLTQKNAAPRAGISENGRTGGAPTKHITPSL